MKGIKKHLVALLSTVLMMTSLGIAPALADDAPLGNDDFNIVVNKKLNPKDLTLDLKIKLEDKDPTTPKVVNDLSQVFKDEGKEKEKLDLVKDKTDEYEMVVSENGEVEFELNYSKEVKAAEGEAEAINRDEKHSFKVNVTEIEEAKAEEPKVEEPKAEEPKAEEPKAEEPKVEEHEADEDVVDGPVINGPSVDVIDKEGLTINDTTEVPLSIDLDSEDKTKLLKLNVGFGDTSSALKNGEIILDFEGSNFNFVNDSNLTSLTEIKSRGYNKLTKKYTIKLKDNVRPDFEISIAVKPIASVGIGEVANIKYSFSGESAAGDTYKTVKGTTKDIEMKGSSYVPMQKASKSNTDAKWSVNHQGWTGNDVGAGASWTSHYRYNIVSSSTGGTLEPLQFDNLIIKRKNVNGFESFVSNSLNIRYGGPETAGFKTSENSSETVYEYGYAEVKSFALIAQLNVPGDAIQGNYDLEYDVYNGTEYLFTHKNTFKVSQPATAYGVSTDLTSDTIAPGETTIFTIRQSVTSGPNPVSEMEQIVEIPNGVTLIGIGNNYQTVKGFEIEKNNSGVFEPVGGVAQRAQIDLTGHSNITRAKVLFNNFAKSYGVDGGSNFVLRNDSLTTGQSADIRVSSLHYKDTNGVLVKVEDNALLKPNLSKKIKGSSTPTYVGQTKLSGSVSTSDGWNGLVWPSTKVTSFSSRLNVAIGANDGAGIEKPFIYIIAPQGTTIKQISPTKVGTKIRYVASIADIPALDYILESIPSDPTVVNNVTLADGRIMYYQIAENNTLRGSQSALEIMQAKLSVSAKNLSKGIHNFEVGIGSAKSDSYTIGDTTGMTQKNMDSEIKSILGATSNKVFTKTLTVDFDSNYETSRKSFVRAPEDSTFTEIITGSEFAQVMPSTDVDFKYELKNTGSVEIKNLEFVDILPFPGDKNITNGLNRGSEFPVYLGTDPKVQKDGSQVGSIVYYSMSSDPKRLDNSGNQIGTGEWTVTKPAVEDIKAIKVVLVDSLKSGEKITLDIKGKLNYDAPRTGEKAYNTIAFTGKTIIGTDETIRVTELPRTGVQAKAPTNAGQISGTVFQDYNKNAVNDSEATLGDVVIDIFEKSDLSTSIHTTVSQATGDYGISNLANGTYNIRVTLPENTNPIKVGNKGLEIDTTDSKYAWVVINGSRDIKIDDVTSQIDIKNIDVPMTKMSSVSGMLKFIDKNAVSGATKYAKDWTVELFNGSDKLGSATVTTTGEFKFENLLLADSGNLKLKITNPNGKTFKVVDTNVNASGEKTIVVTLGSRNTTGTTIEFTDVDLPVITGPTADKALQPTDISYTVTDATTDVTEAWTIKNASGATIASGTKQADVKAAIAAIDAAKNEAKGTTTFKFIPKTAGNEPVLNVTGTSKTVELGSAKPNLKTAFGVTATDKLGGAIADAQITATEIDSIPVDSSGNVTTEGSYKVKLEVTDPTTGLKANKEVTVTVVDTTAPVLTVTPTTINLNLKKGKANALTFDEFVENHLTMTMVEAGSQTGIKLQSDDYSVDFANNGTNTFKVYVVDSAAAKNKSNEVSITVNVEMFDEIDDNNNEAINAHDFNIKLSDVNDANLIIGADAKAYDISVSPKNPVGLTVVSPLPTTVGDHTVKFETAKGTSKEVKAHVFDDIDSVTKEAINGHDFNIKLSDVNDANLIAGADAAAFDVTTNTPVSVAIATVTHSITSVGDYPVKFETAAGTSKEVTAHVYDEINPINNEAINAHDFVIQLSYVNEANVKQLSGLKAFDLSVDPAVQLNNDDINVSALPTTSGVHNITFTTAKGSSITVKAHVFDIVDNVNKIAINANDFSMLIDDVNEAEFIENSGVEAFDVSDVNNITPITDIKVISQLPTTVGKHKVKFEATNAAGNTENIEVDASLFDHGTITPGQGSIFANNFDMKMKNMNNASVIAAAGVTAFDANGNAVDVKDIKLVSALPTTAGFHNFIFEANGVQVTVLGHVTARYQVVGHDLNMTMAEFKAFKANGTIEKEIIKRAEGKVINLDTGEIAELASVDYHTADITKLAPGKYDVVLNYTIDGDFIDEETPSTFGMNKTISKHVNLNITDDSNSGNGSNNGSNNGSTNRSQNGSGNGTNTDSNTSSLPSTGIAVDSTPVLLASGLVVLGFVLMLMNKKKKNEDQ
ncbi:peptidase [Erysipelothrix rhusiopathiae]|uniref:SdrD B-like domain-containing protein n=1 Tax=Erysipelothrix rhusiopathiae TaxID=1648 RepID=UPI00202B830E|nr:SdrD B-like domain-containing protein [Erysipelothrix rhusiopathiae]URQ77021.1 peptidase [Erysipelothrix rhusiopathiae]